MFEQVAPYILALAGIITAIIGLRKANIEGDSLAATNYQALYDNFKKSIADLQASEKENQKQRLEDRERIKVLEKNELEAVRKEIENQNRIKELETANEQSKERLLSLEADHSRLAEIFRRYQRGVNLLIGQLRELKVEPAWTPEKEG